MPNEDTKSDENKGPDKALTSNETRPDKWKKLWSRIPLELELAQERNLLRLEMKGYRDAIVRVLCWKEPEQAELLAAAFQDVERQCDAARADFKKECDAIRDRFWEALLEGTLPQ